MKILLVDDIKTDRMIMTAYLNQLGHEVITGVNGVEAVELYKTAEPDLVLMDVIMPEIDGYEAARIIRKENTDWVPIIYLSARVGADDIAAGIEAGGDDYLTKPVDNKVLEAKVKAMQRIALMRQKLLEVTAKLESANSELKIIADMDGLTGLANRRYLDNFIMTEISRSSRDNSPLCMILADVDHFKLYNDSYGHLAGDDALKRIAEALKDTCKRSTDLVARYGGEEFAIVLSHTSLENGMLVAERIREVVEALNISHEHSSSSGACTMSLGVYSIVAERGQKVEDIIKNADKALYKAKSLGRNQVQS